MALWLVFYCGILFAMFLSTILKNKFILSVFIFFVLAYFSGFRDGLGEDYDNYSNIISSDIRVLNFMEPGFTLVSKLGVDFFFTELIFFVFFAFLTNFFVVVSYYRYRGFFLSIFIYASFSVLYFNSFNLIRQYLAASIVLYSCYYLIKKKWIVFFLMVAFAAQFHFSAIFMLILVLFLYVDARKKIILMIPIFALLFSSAIGGYLYTMLEAFSGYTGLYTFYFLEEADPNYRFGFFSVILNFILFYYYFFVIDESRVDVFDNFIMVCFVVLVTLYNLIPGFYYFYRLSVYFLMFFPMFIVLPIRKPHKNIVLFFLFSLSLFFIANFIYSSAGNDKIIPDGINSPLQIFK
jgi:hypothetical protein